VACVVVVVVVLTSCSADPDATDGGSAPGVPPPPPTAETRIDDTAVRGDVPCAPETLGEDEVTTFITARFVVDGLLGALCLGFSMSVNLSAYDDDRRDALLTIGHEFALVFTLGSSQVDRGDPAVTACVTYVSSSGCFAADSLINEWVTSFWAAAALAEVDPEVEPDTATGAARCALDPSFFGWYAASDPEEDFAETFSAYVFDVAPTTLEQQKKIEWMAAHGFAEFRSRAVGAELTPLANRFEPCGQR
jgi:hypothetical protein